MPIKKKPVSEKEKLQAKTIDQLKRYAKRVGAKIVTPEGKPKTKEQLVNSALMAQRLGAKKPKAVAKKTTARKSTARKTTARKSPVRKAAPRKRALLAANSTEMTRDELMNYLITKVKLKFVKPGEDYSSGYRGQIWVGGENEEKFRGGRALFYYNKSKAKYLNGVIKPLAETIINSGWFYHWNDPGTLFIYKP
jgi:hypothetical protein